MTLEQLAREYLLAEAVINRLSHLINPEVLHALIDANLAIDLADEASAMASADALMKAVGSKLDINIVARFDTAQERWQLRLEKILHGNLKLGVIDDDLLVSGDYAQLRKTAEMLAGLFGPGGVVVRAEKKQAVSSFAETMTAEMPYGRKRALEIATTLALEPDMMLLDEPTQGMGHEDIARVVELIRKVSANRTILMVEHNLSVVANLCDRITVLTRGSVLAEGSYEEVSMNPQVLEAYVGSDNMNDAHH